MIRDAQLPELGSLHAAESSIPFKVDHLWGDLVVANQNESLSVHRWFTLKESFSPFLLPRLLERVYSTIPEDLTILDPFAGVGTTLLAVREIRGARTRAFGIERNPFIAFAAKTKVQWHEIDSTALLHLGETAIRKAKSRFPRLPELSSITTGRCISTHVSQRIVAIRDVIRNDFTPGPTANALLLGLAAAIEPLSKTRKDGRALRLVDRGRPNVAKTLCGIWEQMAVDCVRMKKRLGSDDSQACLIAGDGRDPVAAGIAPNSVDLIVTSPPYPNNIDYSEVYKLELWLLGLVNNNQEFLALRRQTFRSHPTCAIPVPAGDFKREVEEGGLKAVLGGILARSAAEPWRQRLFTGYFSDLWTTLRNMHVCLRPNGIAALIVGNSLHGNSETAYLVPTDLAISKMAESTGFEVQETVVARNLRRRLSGNHFLRESMVVLRKRNATNR